MNLVRLNRYRELVRVRMQVQRADELGLEATLTLDEWLENVALFNGLCAYCQVNTLAALDHIHPVTRGGGTTKDNCVPACKSCNSQKSMRLDGTIVTGESLVDAISRIQLRLKEVENITASIVLVDGPLNDEEQKLTVRFPPDLLDTLRDLAKEDKRSLNSEILWMLQLGLDAEVKL